MIEWLRLWTPKFANRKAQDIRPITNLKAGLIEIIKYGSKIFTEPDSRNSLKNRNKASIYAKALDTILAAMKGTRIFDRFGFDLPTQKTERISNTRLISNFEEWEYDPSNADWINTSNGCHLTNYQIPLALSTILKEDIDLALY
jgi:hypothetical protein